MPGGMKGGNFRRKAQLSLGCFHVSPVKRELHLAPTQLAVLYIVIRNYDKTKLEYPLSS